MGEEQLQTGNHEGGAAEVQELKPRHGEISPGEGGQVGHLGTENGLLHGGPGQPQDRAAPGEYLARHTRGDGADTQVQPPPQSLVLGDPTPSPTHSGTFSQGGLGQPLEDGEYQLVRERVEEVRPNPGLRRAR